MELKTISDVEKFNLFPDDRFTTIMQQTEKILKEHNAELANRNMDIGDTPISPVSLDDEYTPILLSDNVVDTYNKLVETINNPNTALEYSFVLLGKSASLSGEKCYMVDQIIDCSLYDDNLSNRQTRMDNNKLNEIVANAQKSGYNFISIGHTHPNIPEEERQATVANYLSDEEKDIAYIRDAGLNLSLQDFVSYESLYEYFKDNPNIRTCQSIIMYNGEMVMLGKQQNKLSRMTTIMDMLTGEEIYVSSKENYKRENHTL